MLLNQGRLLQFFSDKQSEVCYFHRVWCFDVELGLLHDVTELLFDSITVGLVQNLLSGLYINKHDRIF